MQAYQSNKHLTTSSIGAHWPWVAINSKSSRNLGLNVQGQGSVDVVIYKSVCSVCLLSMCLHVCGWLIASVLQLKKKKKRSNKSEPSAQQAIKSNQSQVSKVIYYPILCLCTAAYREQKDTATATDNMLINWDCTTMPPWRDEALRWLPSDSEISFEPKSLYAEKWYFAGWKLHFYCRHFSLRGPRVNLWLPRCHKSFYQQEDSRIVLWMWTGTMCMPALCVSVLFIFSKTSHTPSAWLSNSSVDGMPHSRLV